MTLNLEKLAVLWKESPDMSPHNEALLRLIRESLPDSDICDYNGHTITQDDLDNVDGVINLGGDGHFLNGARYLQQPEQFIVGFTYASSLSQGHYNLFRGDETRLQDLLRNLRSCRLAASLYQRLDVFLDGQKIDTVLNEVWEKSVSGSSLRHEVRINGTQGSYVHGGFGVATPSGRSGLVGRINPLEIDGDIPNDAVLYRACTWTTNYEEVLQERRKGFQGRSVYDGILPREKSIKVVSLNRDGSAHIVCDGRHELLPNPRVYAFDEGNVLEVKRSGHDLLYLQ